jgi:hypothetical protein
MAKTVASEESTQLKVEEKIKHDSNREDAFKRDLKIFKISYVGYFDVVFDTYSDFSYDYLEIMKDPEIRGLYRYRENCR